MSNITNLRSIYIATLEDAMLAYEVMQEFYGDCDMRQDAQGEYHLTAPRCAIILDDLLDIRLKLTAIYGIRSGVVSHMTDTIEALREIL